LRRRNRSSTGARLDWIYPPGVFRISAAARADAREVLEAVAVFDQRLIAGEEPEMCQRIRARGYLILHLDRPNDRHDLAITRLSQYCARGAGRLRVCGSLDSLCRLRTPAWRIDARRNRLHALAI